MSDVPDELERLKKQPAEERRSPAIEGIWYYAYDGTNWSLEPFRGDDYKGIPHDKAWPLYVAPKIAKAFGLSSFQTSQILPLVHSMPRGRMSRIGKDDLAVAGETPGKWHFWHGDDFPTGLVPESERRRIISAFELNLPARAGNTVWIVSPHEKMVPEDQAKLQAVLRTKIPY